MMSHLLLLLNLTVQTDLATTRSASRSAESVIAPAPDSAYVEAVLARADEATAAGRASDARRLYQGLVNEQRRHEQFAGKAMWRLALNFLYSDNKRRAAEVLDDLSADADKYGDPALELQSTFEAAVLWAQLKRFELVPPRVERVRALLQSPVIPASAKDRVRERM